MKTYVSPALKITGLTLLLFGVLYPVLIVGVASVIAPNSGKGELVLEEGKPIGFTLIGQKFTSDKYFNSRPSAVDYNAAATGGSNKGTGNPDYLVLIDERISNFEKQNPDVTRSEIPVDLVTASGGGLDPHISPQAALVQIKRIARVRSLDESKLIKLVHDHIEQPLFGVLGPKRVHVLKLNLALDNLK